MLGRIYSSRPLGVLGRLGVRIFPSILGNLQSLTCVAHSRNSNAAPTKAPPVMACHNWSPGVFTTQASNMIPKTAARLPDILNIVPMFFSLSLFPMILAVRTYADKAWRLAFSFWLALTLALASALALVQIGQRHFLNL
jgi:hypothetical protein